jgi:hypothetical protein
MESLDHIQRVASSIIEELASAAVLAEAAVA